MAHFTTWHLCENPWHHAFFLIFSMAWPQQLWHSNATATPRQPHGRTTVIPWRATRTHTACHGPKARIRVRSMIGIPRQCLFRGKSAFFWSCIGFFRTPVVGYILFYFLRFIFVFSSFLWIAVLVSPRAGSLPLALLPSIFALLLLRCCCLCCVGTSFFYLYRLSCPILAAAVLLYYLC